MEVGEYEDRSDRTLGGAGSTGAVRRDRAGRVPADGGTGPSRARGDPLRQRRLRDGRATGVGDPRGVAARPRGRRPEPSLDARAGSGLRAGAPVRRHPQPRRLLRPSAGPPRQDAGRDHPARPARPARSADDLRAGTTRPRWSRSATTNETRSPVSTGPRRSTTEPTWGASPSTRRAASASSSWAGSAPRRTSRVRLPSLGEPVCRSGLRRRSTRSTSSTTSP